MSTEETQPRYGKTEARGARSFDALNNGKPVDGRQAQPEPTSEVCTERLFSGPLSAVKRAWR
jgi:hypothetical protein